MTREAFQPGGRRRAGVRPLVFAGIFLVFGISAFGWWAYQQWAGGSSAIVISKISRPVLAPPPAVLDIIPTQGESLASRTIELSANAAVAARAVDIPLDDPVLAAGHRDPDVTNWLIDWRSQLCSSQTVTEQRRARLEESLKNSPLEWEVLFQIGSAFRNISGDALTASKFYEAAVVGANRELQSLAPGAPEARPILTAMNDARRLLWDVVDNVHYCDRPSLGALATINADIVKWASPDDAVLADARRHALIGIPECDFALGHADQAIPMLLALDTSQMTDNEKLGVAWIQGLALIRAHRFSEAVPFFQRVSDDASYQYAYDSCWLLFKCLLYAERVEGASKLRDLVATRYRIDNLTQTMSLILDANDVERHAILDAR